MRGSLSRKFMIRITAILLLITGINLGLDYYEQKNQILQELKEKSRVITGQLLATREFIARNQDRINYDSRGHFEFKGLNPAAVGRGVGEIFNRSTGYQIKQTRLNPRSPGNAPDAFEVKGLRVLAENPLLTEYYGFDELNGERVFRYMVPLRVEESCLQCHGEPAGQPDITGYPKEGYRVGELGGAISLVVPVKNLLAAVQQNLLRHLAFFFILLLVILGVVYLLIHRLVSAPLNLLCRAAVRLGKGELDVSLPSLGSGTEIGQLAARFQWMARQLHDLYTGLEQKVRERTAQLQEANELLERQRQELEKANQELSRASEMKSRFLAGMSHEMRTPLTSIIAFSELLLQETAGKNSLQRQNLQEIKASARRLLALIEDLLDLAKIEAGRFHLQRELVDLADIFESVDKTLGPLREEKGLDWYWEVEPDVPLMEIDGEKIRRAILNLAHNAVKFTPPGGRVEMRAGFDPERKEVFIRVTDSGTGIEPEELDRIFEPFYQAANSRTHKYGGSGLGLSLARELVELHGGYISAASKPGEGSTFNIYLPVTQVP